jgi:hypothetical protein
VIVSAATALAACSGAPDTPPEDVVQTIVDARSTGACAGYAENFVDEGDPFPPCEVQEVVGQGPTIGEVAVRSEEATVEVIDYYDCSTWGEPPNEYVDVYRLVVDDGSWKVDEYEPAEATSDDCFS